MRINQNEYITIVKQDFLSSLLHNWKKRNNKLLHLGIDNSPEPSFFWDLGFDVTALAQNQDELVRSQEANGLKIEYVLGKNDHLPFDDKTFDYVALTHILASNSSSNENLSTIIEEALRVSTKSICILEYSTHAFKKVKSSISPKTLHNITDEISTRYNMQTNFYSALRLPALLWSKKSAHSIIESHPLRFPFGTLMAITIEHSPVLTTSLPLQVSSTAPTT